MSVANAPCKECEKRELGCHATCEEYKEYSDKCKMISEARISEYRNCITANSANKKRVERYLREHKK